MATSQEGCLADPLEIERKIFFFRADQGLNEVNSEAKLAAFDAGPISRRIIGIPPNERQLRRTDGKITFCRTYRVDKPQRLMLTSISESDFPESFKLTDSTFREIQMADDEGVALTTHFTFFDNNIVGMVAPYRGPGAGRLEDYLRKKVHEDDELDAKITLTPLTARDFERRLSKFRTISGLQVRVSHYEVEDLEANESPDDTPALGILRRMRQVGEAGQYEIGWRPRRGAKDKVAEPVARLARRLLKEEGVLEDKNAKMVVKGETEEGRTEEINILDDKVFFEAKVMKQGERSRTLAPGPAFEAIREVYEENREFIERAAAFYT